MEKGVTVIIPVLDRIDGMEKVIRSGLEHTEDIFFILVRSPGREAVHQEMLRLFAAYECTDIRTNGIQPQIGDYARKINIALEGVATEWFLTGADDIRFHPNWFENAMKLAHDPIKVIGTNDLGNSRVIRGQHSTHTLVNTEYAKKTGLTVDFIPGKVLCDTYWHEYCDDELVGVAKQRGIWAFAHDSIVEHMHPDYGKAPSDASYEQQQARMKYSRATFENRRQRWER